MSGGQLADLVQEDRAAISQLEAAQPPLRRPGERALFVAEQFRRNQRWRQRGAVDADERRARPDGSACAPPGR